MFYEVQAIIDKQLFNNKPWYLVKWLHYPISEATWQPPYTLSNVTDLLQEFEQSQGSKFDETVLNDTQYGIQKSDYVRKTKKNKKKRLRRNSALELAIVQSQEIHCLVTPESTSNSSKNNTQSSEHRIQQENEGRMENEDELNPEEEKMVDEKNEKSEEKGKEMINEEDEKLDGIKEIFYLKTAENGERYYLVEKEDGSLEKLKTGKVVKMYPLQFSMYLEGKIKEKLDK